MADDAVIRRLDVIIVLLLCILAILTWPILPTLFALGTVLVVLAGAVVIAWAFTPRRR